MLEGCLGSRACLRYYLLFSFNALCTYGKSSYGEVERPIREGLVFKQRTALIYDARSCVVAAFHDFRRVGLVQAALGWVVEGAGTASA